MIRMRLLLFMGVVALAVSAGTAGAATYSGSLAMAGTYWEGTLSWDVWNLGSGWWQYEYNLQTNVVAPGKIGGITEVVIEVTPDAPADDFRFLKMTDTGWSPWDATATVGIQSPEGIPASMYGISFLPPPPQGDNDDWKWAIVTRHMPTWGDFYAADGVWGPSGGPYTLNTISNPDVDDDDLDVLTLAWSDDPSAPAANGTIHNNILRPDGIDPTPELSSFALLLLGVVPVGYAWRRRKKA